MHRKRILNSNGHEWAPSGENVKKAVDDLPLSRGTVWIPYAPVADPLIIPEPIEFGSGLTIKGLNLYSSVLKMADDVDDSMFKYTQVGNVMGLTLRDLWIDGNKANNVAGSGVESTPADGGSRSKDFDWERVFFTDWAEYGFHVEDPWGFRARNVIAEHNALDGGFLVGATHASLVLSKFNNNGECGLVSTTSRTLLIQTELAVNGYHGYKIGGGYEHTVDDCIIRDNSQDTINTYDGIYIGARGRHRILGSIIDGQSQQRYGVNLIAAARVDCILDNNHIINNVTANINDAGARTRINGHGREDVGAPGAPTAALWYVGDIVRNTNDNTQWIKDYDGVFRQIA